MGTTSSPFASIVASLSEDIKKPEDPKDFEKATGIGLTGDAALSTQSELEEQALAKPTNLKK